MKPDLRKTFVRVTLLFSIGMLSFFAYADDYDYVRDPAPSVYLNGVPVDDYSTANDPQVCNLYLKNLQYFARRNEPLSCGQPVAPILKGQIQPVEWENLDPDKYPELFLAVVKTFPRLYLALSGTPKDEEAVAFMRKAIMDGSVVFRRAKLALKGFPADIRRAQEIEPSKTETPFQIVEYGYDVTDPKDRAPLFLYKPCKPGRGRRMDRAVQDERMRFYIVSEDLRHLYGRLDWFAADVTTLWVVNGTPYGEFFDESGDVQFSQFQLQPRQAVGVEPICLFHLHEKRIKDN